MKTTLKRLKLTLPVIAILFFCTTASAQSLEELVAMQTDLQNFIAASTAKINDASATASMTAQELADFQDALTNAQGKLAVVTPMVNEQYAYALRAREEQIAADAIAAQQAAEAAQAPAKAALAAQYAADQAALEAQIAAKQQAIDNPQRYASAPDPSHPNWMPFFVSTGNAQQDAQMVRDWLSQHGIVR